MLIRCACCHKPFEPRAQVPGQTYCPLPDCQRARKRKWQQAKLQSDPDYRINQYSAQKAWSQRNQSYWQNYRRIQTEQERHNRKQQPPRNSDFVKMDACNLPSGLYRITRHPEFPGEIGNSCIVEITLIHVKRSRKMDVSREDLIDTVARSS